MTCLIVTAIVAVFAISGSAYAYFDRGQVGISPSQSSVSLNAGESRTVSVSLNPASDKQTPGCGMAECPQTCGDLGCLDGNGQCTCAGSKYSTYQTQVSAVSSNGSVARASYSGGAVSISGVSPGTTTVTLTASLRQFRSNSTTITVTVNSSGDSENAGNSGSDTGGSGSSGGSGNSGSSSGSGKTSGDGKSGSSSSSGTSGGDTTTNKTDGTPQKTAVNSGDSAVSSPSNGLTPVSPDSAAEDDTEAALAPASVTSMTGKDGMVYTMAILGSDDFSVKELLANAMGRYEKVTFTKQDEAGNALYSLSFLGSDLTAAVDVDMMARITEDMPENIRTDGDALMLRFDKHEQLPATAELYVAAGTHFGGGATVDIYHIDPVSGKPVQIARDGTATSGYVSLDIQNTNDLILVSGSLKEAGGGFPIIPVGIGIGVIALIAIMLITRGNKKKKRAAAAVETVGTEQAAATAETAETERAGL
ncbi:MAG: hypothetical protein LBL36_05400 [Clostridiales Family XIII bacterium]|nr:hypothetical protein [Clostridiales Family XIII bacterium]